MMDNQELREAIISEIKRNQAESIVKYGNAFPLGYVFEYCTWWFKFKIALPTKLIRRELDRMERDGIVISNKSQSNNTKWVLVEGGTP